ncbi:MAG: GldG family protein [Firmicutes bacterium]|nr:GldG family protein [Bacillota bacterium]
MKFGWRSLNSGVFVITLIGIFVLTVLAADSLPWRWDWTEDTIHSLSEQTEKTLHGLDEEVKVYAFTDSSEGGNQVERLLRAYQKETDQLKVETVDPVKEPSLAKKYGVSGMNTVVFVKGDKQEKVDPMQLFVPGTQGDSYGFKGEEAFTQAILNLTADQKPVVYILQGHGEIPFNKLQGLRDSLEGEGNEVKELNLAEKNGIPHDADILMMAGPTSDLSQKEAKMIQTFIKDGGQFFAAFAPAEGMDDWKQIPKVLETWGVQLGNDVVIDPKRGYYGDPLTPIPQYNNHKITSELEERNMVAVMPRATGLQVEEEKEVEKLLETSGSSFGETDWESEELSTKPSKKDHQGPITLGVAVDEEKKKHGRAVIFGSASMLTGNVFQAQGNRDLVLNSFGWLSKDTQNVTIRPVEKKVKQVYVSAGDARIIFFGTVIVLPLLFLVSGLMIWWRRRRA